MSEDKKEMSVIEHLDALRKHLVRAAIALGVGMIVGFIFVYDIFDKIIMAPARSDFWTYKVLCSFGEQFCVDEIKIDIVNLEMGGQFTMAFTTVFVTGFILAFPYIFWELWRFIKPALSATEQRFASSIVFVVCALFFLGVAFGYYIVSPMTVYFMLTFQLSPIIKNLPSISSYISTVSIIVLGCGVLFELPVVVYFLSKIGLLTPSFLRKNRRYAGIVILIFSAIITPTQDAITLLLFFVPIYFLFEISILVSARVEKNRQKEMKKF